MLRLTTLALGPMDSKHFLFNFVVVLMVKHVKR